MSELTSDSASTADPTFAAGAGAPPADPPVPPTGGGNGGGGNAGAPEPHPVVEFVRMLVRGLGQLLVTAGVIVLLFVVYEVYVTNWFAHREQHKVHVALEQEWNKGELALPETGLAALDGHGIANLYIPRFGRDYAWTIVQGTNDADHAIRAAVAAEPEDGSVRLRERDRQRALIPTKVRMLVLEDQQRRNDLCWSVFAD